MKKITKKLLIMATFLLSILLNGCIPAGGTTPAGNPAAVYMFSGNANDSSGHGKNGTVHNATLTQDRFGYNNRAYEFSYANGSYIEIPTMQSILDSSNEFSISMWLKFSGIDAGPTPLQLYPDNPSDRLMISVPYHPNATPADIYWDHGDIDIGRLNIPIITFTTWKHFVFTKSVIQGRMQIFIDGVLSGSKLAAVNITNKNRKFRIGGGGPGTETFNGAIDDIKIYKRELTQAEVTKLFNNQM